VSLRIGERVDPPKDDARHRLNQLVDSKFDEEESSAGPVCFGPRIRNEPFLAKFALPHDMPKYTGAVKPEDWLSDYVTAVDIAGGNKRTAVRYAPLMLIGSAQCGSIAGRLCRSIHGMTSKKHLSRTSPGLTSDHPARGSWPSTSKVRTN
jgi:hypothetical protein